MAKQARKRREQWARGYLPEGKTESYMAECLRPHTVKLLSSHSLVMRPYCFTQTLPQFAHPQVKSGKE
jgi:hypothetical protein